MINDKFEMGAGSSASLPVNTIAPNPDDPPWGVPHALVVWVISVALLIVIPLLTIAPYLIYRVAVHGALDNLATDPNLIFMSILGVFPVHILSALVVWLVVTNRGRRPFWQTLGWRWPSNLAPPLGPLLVVFLAMVLFVIGYTITWLVGGSETQLDLIIKSSYNARFATAFLAAVTGPFVEELIYRGVLYPALQRAFGALWAVVAVSTLFTGVHVLQYFNNLGVIAVIALLSIALTLLRAVTGTLLPSYVMHLVFNGIQALFLVIQPFLNLDTGGPEAAPGILISRLWRLLT
jgi:membrane protease YdiL (CAAX protease family)